MESEGSPMFSMENIVYTFVNVFQVLVVCKFAERVDINTVTRFFRFDINFNLFFFWKGLISSLAIDFSLFNHIIGLEPLKRLKLTSSKLTQFTAKFGKLINTYFQILLTQFELAHFAKLRSNTFLLCT